MSLNSDTKATLDKFEQFLDDQGTGKKKLTDFTEDDVTVLKRVIKIVKGLEAFGSLADFVKSTIIWFGVIVGAFIAMKNGLIEFIIHSVSSNNG